MVFECLFEGMCKRCGAQEKQYFYKGKCRRCVGLRVEEPEIFNTPVSPLHQFPITLTNTQQKVSEELIELVGAGHNVYVEAVCGAGKTEMCLDLIKESLMMGLKVGWAIPRREVVLELGERLQSYFPKLKVVFVCGGHTQDVWGDLIVCTTHQLYRYHQYFDVLIIDEPDAFPFYKNDMLEFIAHASCRGPLVYLSATYEVDDSFKKVSCSERPSGKLLNVPEKVYLIQAMRLIHTWRNEMLLVFVPTRKQARMMSILLNCPFITSHTQNKIEILESFRTKGGILVCTSVLERGVTFKDCFVVVLWADHPVFNLASLVQIAGRVGRGMNPRKGEVVFHGHGLIVKEAIQSIQKHNTIACSALKSSV